SPKWRSRSRAMYNASNHCPSEINFGNNSICLVTVECLRCASSPGGGSCFASKIFQNVAISINTETAYNDSDGVIVSIVLILSPRRVHSYNDPEHLRQVLI